jgi:hypothetical protein
VFKAYPQIILNVLTGESYLKFPLMVTWKVTSVSESSFNERVNCLQASRTFGLAESHNG